jgi:phosphatidylglycerophosphate synthase
MLDINKHKRVNETLLAPLERPVLQWLAAHMPAWVTPDKLTGVGMIGAVVIFFGYSLTYYNKNFLWLACLGFIINWFGDSLDGTLARYRNIQRPKYGFFIDHTMDALSEVLVFTGLGLSPYVHFGLAYLALVGYLLMSILVYVRTCVNGEFKISYVKIGPTEMRLIAIGANILVYFIGNPTIRLPLVTATIYDFIVAIIAVLLLLIFLISTLRQANQLAKQEAIPDTIVVGKTEG